jgi:hypothetical protein
MRSSARRGATRSRSWGPDGSRQGPPGVMNRTTHLLKVTSHGGLVKANSSSLAASRAHLNIAAAVALRPDPRSRDVLSNGQGLGVARVIGWFEFPSQSHDLSPVARLLVDPVEGSIESRLATASSTHRAIESSLGAGE